MIYPSADKLNKIGSKYKLVAMAAARSKQIKAGMKPLIETTSTNPLTIAFEEIADGAVTAIVPDIDEIEHIEYDEMAKNALIDIDLSAHKDLFDGIDEEKSKHLDDVIADVFTDTAVEATTSKMDAANEILSDTPEVDELDIDKDDK